MVKFGAEAEMGGSGAGGAKVACTTWRFESRHPTLRPLYLFVYFSYH
jgi:hypothetical protein